MPDIITETIHVPSLDNPMRLSDYAIGKFITISSRKGLKTAIKKGLVKINGRVGYTGDYISGGETIELYQDTNPNRKPSIDLTIEVIYEDDYLAIVNKPAGILVSGNKKWTLENALSGCLKPSTKPGALQRAEPIHRLDYPTTGALLIGKTTLALIALNRLFEKKQIDKCYFAVTQGDMPNQGAINSEIDGKTAHTEYEVLKTLESPNYEFLNLVKLIPRTGRRHQLRKHMAGIGNPIFGDAEYGTEGYILKAKGLYLHAATLQFTHPETKECIKVSACLPKKFIKLFPEFSGNY